MPPIEPSKQQLPAPHAPEKSESSWGVENLSPSQQAALVALAGGETLQAAADAAGVSRMTLWRWLRRKPEFAAAYRDCRQELRESTRIALLQASDKAVSAVAKAAADGDAKIALAMLREMGILRSAGRCGRV